MSNYDDRLVQWLRDAHAMEEQALTMMQGQVSRLEHFPQLRSRLEQHIRETETQKERLRERLEQLNGGPSTMKDTAGKLTAMMQTLGGIFAGDEVVKGAMAGYTFEHFEVSAYRALAAAAQAAGDTQTKTLCEDILKQEEAMAEWLDSQMPGVVQAFLDREAAGETAKR